MQLKYLNNLAFAVAADGRWSRRNGWRLFPDSSIATEAEQLAFRSEVEAWAGAAGEAFRLPAADGGGFEYDTGWQVTAIHCHPGEDNSYEITYEAIPVGLTGELLHNRQLSSNIFGERERQAVWLVKTEQLDGFLPEIGQELDWAGEHFRCESVDCRNTGVNLWEVTVRAKDMQLLLLGEPSYHCSDSFEQLKEGRWQVASALYAEFLAANAVNQPADWAGKDYFVIRLSAEPLGKLGFLVAVTARHISVRQLEVRRLETFSGFDAFGQPKRNLRWLGRWRVRADAREQFENITALAPADWASSDCIVTSVTPRRINDLESEYLLEACSRNNVLNILNGNRRNDDDRSDLARREDVRIRGVREYRMSAKDCGYIRSNQGYLKIRDYDPYGWDFEYNSPLRPPNGVTSEWPTYQIERTILCIELEIVNFLPGGPAGNVADAIAFYSANVVFNGALAGYEGSWRCADRQLEAISNSAGELWSKLTERWLLAPAGYQWNSQYWQKL